MTMRLELVLFALHRVSLSTVDFSMRNPNICFICLWLVVFIRSYVSAPQPPRFSRDQFNAHDLVSMRVAIETCFRDS